MDDKEVIKALETVKEYCDYLNGCEKCVLYGMCLKSFRLPPEYWDIEEGDKNEKD